MHSEHEQVIEESENEKKYPEELLRNGNTIQLKPNGWSMYPLFVPGRDWAILSPVDPLFLKRGDVALFRRPGSILVMHRIWKRIGNEFWFVGDNLPDIEGPVEPAQIAGKLTYFIRKGKKYSVANPGYKILSTIWLWMRPLRPAIHGFMRIVRHQKKS